MENQDSNHADSENHNNDHSHSEGHRRNHFDGERKMFKVKCSECGVDAEVPFEPTEGRDVFCRDCYRKRTASRRY